MEKNIKMKPDSNEKGFTLVDLIVVVCIIGILAVIAIPYFKKARVKANESSAVPTIRVISQGENIKHYATGKYFSLRDLYNENLIDVRFDSGEANAMQAQTGGYDYQVTLIEPAGANELWNYVLSAKPSSSGTLTYTGTKRFGMDKAATIYFDANLEDHFATSDEVNAATSFGNEAQ